MSALDVTVRSRRSWRRPSKHTRPAPTVIRHTRRCRPRRRACLVIPVLRLHMADTLTALVVMSLTEKMSSRRRSPARRAMRTSRTPITMHMRKALRARNVMRRMTSNRQKSRKFAGTVTQPSSRARRTMRDMRAAHPVTARRLISRPRLQPVQRVTPKNKPAHRPVIRFVRRVIRRTMAR